MSDTIPILITGAGGYLGRELLPRLARHTARFAPIVAMDVRAIPEAVRVPGIEYIESDVRGPGILEAIRAHRIRRVVHLASILAQTPGMTREFMRSVDVDGTVNVVEACIAAGVEQIVVTSSGAAYGYHADNPRPLREDHPLRGNEAFPYAAHKREVEERLAEYRRTHPQLKQLVLRVATILGAATENQITALFHKPAVLGIAGADSPFVFIWDQDAAEVVIKGLVEMREGIYNVVGDGMLPMREVARILGKPYVPVPAAIVRGAIRALRLAGATRYGPEQVDFIRYRTVLGNDKLKAEFGYTPQKTTREVFEYYLEHARRRGARQ